MFPQTHAVTHLPEALVSWSTNENGRSDPVGVTVSVNVWPRRTPENLAGGGGSTLTGPASTR